MKKYMSPFFICMSCLLLVSGAQAATSITFVGNSITAGYGLPDTTKRYPSLLLKMLGTTYLSKSIVNPSSPLSLINGGVSGRTLLKKGNQPYWIESAFSQIFATKPGIVTLMLGTNDTKPVNWAYASEFESDYTAMVDTFLSISPRPQVVLCLPPAIFTNTFTISDSVMINGVVPKIQSVANAKGLQIIDTRTPTLSKQSLFKDGVHPDSVGHKMLADIFYESILNYTTSQLYKIRFLWYGNAPGMIGAGTDTLAKPFLHVYPVAGNVNTKAAVIICPGGGYTHLSMQKEGDTVGQWFAKNGVTAFVLRYRYNPYLYPVPGNDAKRAMRLVRYYASSYGIDTTRIGIMGFSAGGHVASTLGTHYDNGNSVNLDPVEKKKSKPDFLVLIYPVITMTGTYTHTGSRDALFGTSPAPSTALLDSFSNQKWVTPQTPQTFLAHGDADVTVPIQNSRMFDSACAANNVSHKFMVDPGKPHGYGMVGLWPDTLLAWMKSRGIMLPPVQIGLSQSSKVTRSSLFTTGFCSNKELKITFYSGVKHKVAIYSINGRIVTDIPMSEAAETVWRPASQGVYVVRVSLDGADYFEKVNVAY